MITVEQLTGEIAALQEETPTHASMQKLANLYIVRDHMILQNTTADVLTPISDSDFMKKASGTDHTSFMRVMDELMSTLSVINPPLYQSVMRML